MCSGGEGVMTCIFHVQNVYYFRNNTSLLFSVK